MGAARMQKAPVPDAIQTGGCNYAINATRKDSVNNCGEPLNCPFNILVTVRAKLKFGRIDPDLEPERSRAARRDINKELSA
jgi:hypothetical protein